MSDLQDHLARAQVDSALDQTLFVEAGAGSGKTSSLVKRIVALVESGVPIESIAAITFTEAAATELRHRVRVSLNRREAEASNRSLQYAIDHIESAAITTLHGFALRLLTQFPVEAGLPPGFGVADEISSMIDFDEAWRVFAGRIGDDLDLLELQARGSALDVSLGKFREVARRIDDNWDLLEGVELDPPPLGELDLSAVVASLLALGQLCDNCPFPDDKYRSGIERFVASVEPIQGLQPLDQIDALQALSWPKRYGKKGNWTTMDLDRAKAIVGEAQARLKGELDALRETLIEHFTALVAGFVSVRVIDRQSKGELSFHDLLVLARRLLRNNEQIRLRLHQQFSRILLDEFQDTDPIQIELAVLLAAADPVGSEAWADLAPRLPAGRLVVVGDPKQSIYRFRRADIGVYTEAETRLVDASTQLTTNFRSVPGIVEFVNHQFSHLIGAGDPGKQPAYTPLHAYREADADRVSPPVVVIGRPHEDLSAGEIRQAEAEDVAAVICRAMDEGWRVHREDQWRPVRLADIAILIPSRLSMSALESALSAAGLPFRPETSSLVYATQEVRDVLAGIRAVVEPMSSVDVVAALRSSLFSVDDEALLTWKQRQSNDDEVAAQLWDYRPEVPPALADHPVAVAFETLRIWYQERWWVEPSALIDTIVRERRLREQALAAPRPRDRWRRYRFLSEQARQFTALQGGDLHDFVAWVEIQSGDLARVTEPIPAEPDDDAVRVLTIHGSKGLEFPMTVLAGASTIEQGGGSRETVIFAEDGRPEVKLGKGRMSKGFEAQASTEEVLDASERVRLHYVAATRARDILVISAHHKPGRPSIGARNTEVLGDAALLGGTSGLEDGPALWVGFQPNGDERYEAQSPTQLRLAPGSLADERRQWEHETQRMLELNTEARARSATGVARQLVAQAPGLAEQDDEQRPWRRGRAGTAIGSAVHAVLQQVDLATGAGLADLARLEAERESIAALAPRVEELARLGMASAAVTEALTGEFWREIYVAVPAGLGVLEGYIDLLFETPEGLVIVDFKTDQVRSEADVDRLLAGYGAQGAAYAVALEQIAAQPVVDCRFVFLGADGVIERSVPDLTAAVAEVRALLAEIP